MTVTGNHVLNMVPRPQDGGNKDLVSETTGKCKKEAGCKLWLDIDSIYPYPCVMMHIIELVDYIMCVWRLFIMWIDLISFHQYRNMVSISEPSLLEFYWVLII